MEVIFIVVYWVSMCYILLFGMVQMHLAIAYRKREKQLASSDELKEPLTDAPPVTVQLPVYNEKYVVQRLIDCITKLDYPKSKLEIQVLDDSDDETSQLVSDKVSEYTAAGFDICHIRREHRTGFKAGALQYGLEKAKGDYIAIFDADFLPERDFLHKVLTHFDEEKTGMIQTKWGHLNKNFSILTKLQAFGLNGHFSVEQTGRSKSGSFINFNGTGGIWRKDCIIDAGGWHSDTLTEDLDLSYRAQMKGWKFKFLEKMESPAELPIIMSAIKSQQFRWNKGGAETARKNIVRVLLSSLSLKNKIHAFFHLTGSANFLFLLIVSLLSLPLLYFRINNPALNIIFQWSTIFVLGFFCISFFYWTATKGSYKAPGRAFIKYYPLFLIFSMGMTLHNGIAVLEGWLGFKTPFIRTPKFNVIGAKGQWPQNIYLRTKISWITILEGILCIYFILGVYLSFLYQDYPLLIFQLMLATGYAGVFYYSIKER